MAEATQPALIRPGMLVKCGNKLCNVENVVNELGFNRYIVCAVDTGEILSKSRYELEEADLSFLDNKMEADEPNVSEDGPKILEPEKKKARFETINDEDLNKLALNRNSKHTRTQTAWGVTVFKGKYKKVH